MQKAIKHFYFIISHRNFFIMQETIHKILTKYWGYAQFRPLQQDIIESVLAGNDTLALLPTGGGKSICFQVPAMAMDGICIVISPLIALMKDQVTHLKEKGIKAVAIYSGMSYNEIDIALDHCVYGDIKFLYVSPERLQTEILIERIKKMKICLLAVDEAHCISQWGYDFRPPYLRIAEIKQFINKVPILALTATATPKVVKDIQEKLEFKKENVFQKSFERKNLVYMVLKDENKMGRLLSIINKVKGTGIIYVGSRKKTKEIAVALVKQRVSADFYHAGLEPKVKDLKQQNWMQGKTRIIVSTNAFGMGIDKPNVRFVVHLDIPNSIEAYFQEAGRGGRDEQKAFAVVLFDEADIVQLDKSFHLNFPELDEIKRVYTALGNYFQIAVGTAANVSYDFNIIDFSEQYKFNPIIAFNALKFLEKEGYIILTDAVYAPSKLYIPLTKDNLYKFQVVNPYYDVFLKVILRSYSGLFDGFVKIDEKDIAKKTQLKVEEVVALLEKLQKFNVLEYVPFKDKPQIIFPVERVDTKDMSISKMHYEERKNVALERLNAIKNYVVSSNKCRSQLLIEYFGQLQAKRCGVCDVCLNRNKIEANEVEFNTIVDIIKPILKEQTLTKEAVMNTVKQYPKEKVQHVLKWLIDNNKILVKDGTYMSWVKKDN